MYGGTLSERKKKEEEAAKKAAKKAADKAKREDKKKQQQGSAKKVEEQSIEATAVGGAQNIDVGREPVDGVTDGYVRVAMAIYCQLLMMLSQGPTSHSSLILEPGRNKPVHGGTHAAFAS